MPEQVTYTSACGCSYRCSDTPGATLYGIVRCQAHRNNYSNRQVLMVATPFARQ